MRPSNLPEIRIQSLFQWVWSDDDEIVPGKWGGIFIVRSHDEIDRQKDNSA